jgi:hypothetical protein
VPEVLRPIWGAGDEVKTWRCCAAGVGGDTTPLRGFLKATLTAFDPTKGKGQACGREAFPKAAPHHCAFSRELMSAKLLANFIDIGRGKIKRGHSDLSHGNPALVSIFFLTFLVFKASL